MDGRNSNKMKNNYYDIQKRNNKHLNKSRKNRRTHTPNSNGRSYSSKNAYNSRSKQQSNYRKRKARKLNYKKLFFALLILFLLIFLICSGFGKLISKIKNPKRKIKLGRNFKSSGQNRIE